MVKGVPRKVPEAVLSDELPSGLPGAHKQLLAAMLNGYSNHQLSRGATESHVKSCRSTVLDFLGHARGIPGTVTPEDFERWSAHLFQDRRVAAGTQRRYQSQVRHSFEYWVQSTPLRNAAIQVLGADIIQVVTPENAIIHRRERELSRDRERRAFSPDELERFFGALEAEIEFAYRQGSKALRPLQRDKVMFAVARGMGLRAAELRGLNTSSFQQNDDFPEFGRYGLVRVFGKGSKWRTVPVESPDVADLLAWYVKDVRPGFMKLDNPNETALFVTERGARISYQSIYNRLKRICAIAGLPVQDLSPHSLRHTSVSESAMEGQSLYANQQKHGHAHASTTQGYTHVPDDFIRAETKRLVKKRTMKEPDK